MPFFCIFLYEKQIKEDNKIITRLEMFPTF